MSKRNDFKVEWSVEDQEYAATCPDYPSLSFLSDTPEAALHGMIQLIKEVVEPTAQHIRWDNISWGGPDGTSVIGHDAAPCFCISPWRHWP